MKTKYTEKQIKKAIAHWTNVLESMNKKSSKKKQLNEAAPWKVDVDMFNGQSELQHTFTDALKTMRKIDSKRGVVENKDDKMYAMSGRLIWWLAENLDNMFLEKTAMKKAEALAAARDFFNRNDFWHEVAETEDHKKGRAQAEWEHNYRNRGDNFTGD